MAFEDGVFATFYDHAVENKRQSKEKGFPVFDEVTYIKIVVPNQVDNQPRPVQEKDKDRFPKSWQAYKTGKEVPETGFPLQEWPQISVGELRVCQANNIKTVEQLSEVADSTLHRLGQGGTSLKNKAQKYLDERGEVEALRKEVKELRAQVEAKPQRKRLKVAT